MRQVRARLKSPDHIIGLRYATGWYCEIGGKSFILLEDAEWETDADRGTTGAWALSESYFVEIQPDTIEEMN